MRIALRNQYFSNPRYSRYLAATDHNKERAKKLYNGNIRLAQAFHPLLSQFEVVLRNSLNSILADHYKDPDWIINQQGGFMAHHSLNASRFFLKTSVEKTVSRLRKRSVPVSSGNVIADQTLGFWVALFLPHHYALVNGKPIQIFVNKPAAENRASIYRLLEDIKELRNRVNHCEPLCFAGNTIDCSYVQHMRSNLYDLINWIDPVLVSFFDRIDSTRSRMLQVRSA